MANPRNLADIAPLVSESSNNVGFTNTINLGGGVAGGVVYLNGSKVATSGTGLTFDGTNLSLAAPGNLISTIQSTSTTGPRSATLRLNVASAGGDDPAGTISFTYGTGFTQAAAIDVLHTNPAMKFVITNTEQMRLTSTGLGIGLGGGSPGEKLQVAGAIRATGAVAANTTGGILAYQGSSTVMLGSWGADASTYGALQFYQANSTGTLNRTGMLLDSSGNLGIGTNSPSVRLQTNATINTAYSSSNTLAGGVIAYIKNASTTNSTDATIRLEATGSGNLAAASISALHTDSGFSALTFGTRADADVTERMRLDSSGNLGLGVTPSAGSTHIDVSNGGAYFGLGNGAQVAGNAYFSSSQWLYKAAASTPSARIDVNSGNNGSIGFFTAPSGTAGNAIPFTQAMMLDASGNLVLGETSTSYRFQIGNGTTTGVIRAGTAFISIDSGYQSAGVYGTATAPALIIGGDDNTGIWHPASDVLAISTGGTERARITSSGVFQIANGGAINLTTTASGNGNISFDGSTFTIVSNSSSASLVFSTNSTERASINPSGKLRIGASTTPAAVGDLQINTAAPMLRLEETTTGGSKRLDLGVTSGGNAYIGANQSAQSIEFQTVGTPRMTLASSGNLLIGNTVDYGGGLNISRSVDNGTGLATDISNFLGSYVIIHNQDNVGTGNKTGLFFAHAGAPGLLSGIASTKNSGTWQTNLDFYVNNITGAPSTGVIQHAARIDSSGNLGLGVTPSAWNTTFYTALQVGAGASFFGSKSNAAVAWMGANTFFNSSNSNTYIAAAAATQYRQLDGEHAWFISTGVPSVGGPISFTQAMTLDLCLLFSPFFVNFFGFSTAL